MFDAHAHPGEITADALVCSSSPSQYGEILPYSYKALGTIPEGGMSPDLSLIRKAVEEGFLIGETGLDGRYPERDLQLKIFRSVLSIASECGTPVVIHAVRSYDAVLSEIRRQGIRKFMIHGFSSSYEIALEVLRLGGIISLSPRAERLKAFSRILTLPFVTETDMKTGEEERNVLSEWNGRLSEMLDLDAAERSEKMIKEFINA